MWVRLNEKNELTIEKGKINIRDADQFMKQNVSFYHFNSATTFDSKNNNDNNSDTSNSNSINNIDTDNTNDTINDANVAIRHIKPHKK